MALRRHCRLGRSRDDAVVRELRLHSYNVLMPSSPADPGNRNEGGSTRENERLFRFEYLLGFREPKEHGTTYWISMLVLGIGALAVLVFLTSEELNYISMVMLYLSLVVQGTGDFFYHKDRKLSALLRLTARGVVLPTALVFYVVVAYLTGGAGLALLASMFGCLVVAIALLVARSSGPRKQKGPGPL